MTSGPYQSNVLRFFVRQYWQGLARHKKAVRQTRYTVVSSAQVGCSVSVALAQVAIAAVHTTGKTVKRLASRRQGKETLLSGLSDKVVGLLNFADFVGFPSDWDKLALTQSDDGVRLSENEGLLAEGKMVRSLVAVASLLSPKQIELLSNASERDSEAADSMLTRCVRWGQRSLQRWFNHDSIQPSDPNLAPESPSEVCAEPRLITGIASNLKTRSLVLIKDYRWVWDGLNAEQQRRLHREIATLLVDRAVAEDLPGTLKGDVLGERALSGAMNLAVSEDSCDLAVPTVSFWVTVLQAVAWLQQQVARAWYLPSGRFRLTSGVSLLADSGSIGTQNSIGAQFEGASFGSGMIIQASDLAIARRIASEITNGPTNASSGDAANCIEASVLTESYVEHPLETLLNWVDRCLLWLENGWRRLVLWLRR